jgi:glutamate---cysteine ligase / carboxylate-amine ligase
VRGWPRSGVPRAMHDYEDFVAATRLLVKAADVPDYTWFWWKLRPHPRLGTVEIRALDAQSSLEDLAALVAFVHCLAREAASAPHVRPPAAGVLNEGLFRAARFGVNARLPDALGELRPVSELLKAALQSTREHARELGCEAELAGIHGLLERGGGASCQRSIYEIAGMAALLRELTARTGSIP